MARIFSKIRWMSFIALIAAGVMFTAAEVEPVQAGGINLDIFVGPSHGGYREDYYYNEPSYYAPPPRYGRRCHYHKRKIRGVHRHRRVGCHKHRKRVRRHWSHVRVH